MKDKAKVKFLLGIVILLGILYLVTLLYIQIFPRNTDLYPSNYFNIDKNATTFDFCGLNNLLLRRGEGESMYPSYNNNSLLIYNSNLTISVGDVIIFNSSQYNDVTGHRVIEINGDEYLTKGDNNRVSDNWINRSQVIGRVVGVLY